MEGIDNSTTTVAALSLVVGLLVKLYDRHIARKDAAREREEKLAGLVVHHLDEAVRVTQALRKGEVLDLLRVARELETRVNVSLARQSSKPLAPTEYTKHVQGNLDRIRAAVDADPKPF